MKNLRKISSPNLIPNCNFAGYENEETVETASLLPSAGAESINAQIKASNNENPQHKECNGNVSERMDFEETNYPFTAQSGHTQMPAIPPPLPPQLIARFAFIMKRSILGNSFPPKQFHAYQIFKF